MHRTLRLIFVCVFALFSIEATSQIIDTVKSAHPKMDKYYPQPLKTHIVYAADSNSANPASPVTQVQPTPSMTKAPVTQNTVVSPAPRVKQTLPAAVEPETPPAPAVTSTPVSVEPSNTTVTNSNTVIAPPVVTVNKPVQPRPAPQASTYVDPASLFTTRLGSSAPQYNTWKKNDDGAGSVTTQSK